MLSEFRQDLVSGDWVLFSTGRKHSIRKFMDSYEPKEGCPFEDPKKSGQEIIWGYPDNVNWRIMVIKNKYPAVKPGLCGPNQQIGPFNFRDATGEHGVIIYKDHDIHLADFTTEQMIDVIRVYKKRYQEIAKASNCVEYVMIFHNYGKEAGASIYHPHSQIISTSVMPPDVSRSLFGAYRFYRRSGKRVHEVMVGWELEQKKRIIYENDLFVAFCPFVSRSPYEVRIFPRSSHAHFEKMPDEFDKYLADSLIAVLRKIKKTLNNPPYNFFIHTAPVEEKEFEKPHEFYTWHIEILPKLSISAGFELGTGIDINVIDPDQAARELRKV